MWKRSTSIGATLLLVAACTEAPAEPEFADTGRFSVHAGVELIEICHWSEEEGAYEAISLPERAEDAHRDHGDGQVGEAVPGMSGYVFGEDCQPETAGVPAIDIEKSTNGHDADLPPGPTLTVGDNVQWSYVVTNTGSAPLTDVTVSDDQAVTVTCPKTTLAVGEFITCSGNGTASLGQYANLGTVTATGPGAVQVQDVDPSHYFGDELN